MTFFETMFEKARRAPQRVAFPEATEEKILQVARSTADEGIGYPVLVGLQTEIEAAAASFGVKLDGLEIYDISDEAKAEALVAEFIESGTILGPKKLKRLSADPMYVALMLQKTGKVGCSFAGLSHTTGDVILAAQTMLGLQEGVTCASSIGIFDIPGYEGPNGTLLAFGDSAVCACPDPEDLAGIAISACSTVKGLLGWEPKCALLSFSTDGSAEHEMVEKIREAVRIAKEKRPDLNIDGEFQLDAAINPKVAQKKVKRESSVAGQANIIIWPDLNVGNVGVKLVQQFAHADAYGPTLQGFNGMVSDCSRGAPVSELLGNVAMLIVRTQDYLGAL